MIFGHRAIPPLQGHLLITQPAQPVLGFPQNFTMSEAHTDLQLEPSSTPQLWRTDAMPSSPSPGLCLRVS